MATTDNASSTAPYLARDPPPLAARSLATILVLLFVAIVIAAFVVEVPETVSARFVVSPVTGSDPVRTLYQGTVAEVHVVDAQVVSAGELLFLLASEPVGDRQAERAQLEMQLGGAEAHLANERRRHQHQRRADEAELARLESRRATLTRQAELKQQQLTLVREVAGRQQRAYDQGVSTWMQSSGPRLDVDRLAVELEQTRAEADDTASSVEKLRHEMNAQDATLTEFARTVRQQVDEAGARKSVLDAYAPRTQNRLRVSAPCSGSVVKLNVRAPGAVVNPGDALAEIVCGEALLQAELEIPQLGMALIRAGQPVRLFYDAFPYQRYGARSATLRWVSPASTVGAPGASFRAFADLKDVTVPVRGQGRPVMAGMAGRAAVITGRRSLVSYAIEPIRQIRENLASNDR